MIRHLRFHIALAATGALLVLSLAAPVSAADEGPARSVPELRHLKYRSLGPARGGRVDRVAGVAGDPRIYYAATARGMRCSRTRS